MHLELTNLLLVLLSAIAAGRVAMRIGFPPVLGELLVGILLGPPILGLLYGTEGLEVLAEVGVLLMMLYIGMEIDPRELGKASTAGMLAALGGFIVPLVACTGLMLWLGESMIAAAFVGIAAAVTSLATKSRILVDLDIVNTRIAHVMMAGALIADTLSLVAFATVLSAGRAGGSGELELLTILDVLGRAVVFFLAVGFVGKLWLPRLSQWMRGSGVVNRTGSFTIILAIAVAFAELAELAGLHGVVGTFAAGLFLSDKALGRQLSAGLRATVHDASIGFLAPIFFVTAGFQFSFAALVDDAVLVLALFLLATVSKIAGTALFYRFAGHGWVEGLTVGAGMNGRGAVEIILAGIALNAGIIDDRVFSMLVFLAIATTATVPVLLGIGVRALRARDALAATEDARRGVIIVGAGDTARALGRLLAEHTEVSLVDTNAERCQNASNDGLETVQGNALEEHILESAGAEEAATIIALTPNASVNAVVARMGRMLFEIPYIYVLAPDTSKGHVALIETLDVRSIFGKAVDIESWDKRLREGRVEVGPIDRPYPDDVVLPMVVHDDPVTPYHDGDGDADHPVWGLRPVS